MKKRIIISLLTLVCIICCVFGLSACGGGSSVKGTYYLYENGQYVKSNYITLDSDKWTDDDGESGDYAISGENITLYVEFFGEKEEFANGTVKNGVLTLNIMGEDIVYCKEGKAPSDGGQSGEKPSSQKYTVTYDANGGKFENDSTTFEQKDIAANSTLTAPDSPIRTGYCFGGWATNKSGSEMWKFATDKVTKNITLYAVWEQESATILSVDGANIDGTDIFMLVSPDTDSVSLSNKVVCSTDSVWKLYYDKLGQTEIPTKIAAGKYGELNDGDNVFYIVVTSSNGSQVNVYELTVHRSYAVIVSYYHKGESLKTQTVYTGETFTADYKPDISGYTFNGWKTAENQTFVSEILWGTLFLYADTTANTYTVTLDVNNGNELSENTKTVTYDESFTFAVPLRTGYSFQGWYIGSTQITDKRGESVAAWTYTSNKTATAKWRANQYAVTVKQNDADAGTVTGSGMYSYDSNVTVTATTNPGYNFLGWYDNDGNLVSENRQYTFKMDFAVTYTAKWDYYTVTTDKTVGGSVTSYSDTKISVGKTVKLTATTNVGYTFIGWYNGETKLTDELSYTFTMPAENVVYTAKWQIAEEMVGFNFTSTSSTCTITGIKDKTVTDIVVPDYVTSISSGAFSGCTSLESITIPFVGAKAGVTASDTYQYPFGYIFGTSNYTGGTATQQYYYGSSTSSTTSTTYYIPSSLRKVTVTGGNILYGAFYKCNNLTSIEIPDSVTSIGKSAFFNCSSLTSVTIGNSVTSIGEGAFQSCSSLTSVVIPDSVKSIGSNAFQNCSSLTSVTFGENSQLTSIGTYAFSSCSSLTSIEIPDSVTSIGAYAFYYCYAEIIWGDDPSITTIGGDAFRGYKGNSITIPDSVTSIGYEAFKDCSSLTSVYITDMAAWCNISFGDYYANPLDYAHNLYCNNELVTDITAEDLQGVTSIGEYAFVYCSSLTSIEIPDSVTSIGSYAFEYCSGLTSVYITDIAAWCNISFGSSDANPLSYAHNLYLNNELVTEITAEDLQGVTKIGDSAFKGCSLTSIEIPDSVTSIGSNAFQNCSSLTSVTFGENSQLTSIGSSAFSSCSSLTSIEIPDSVTSIGTYAFSSCSSLTSIEIPDSVTSIGSNAFQNCSSLTSVTFGENSQLTSIGSSAFYNCSSLEEIAIPFVGASETATGYSSVFGYIFGYTTTSSAGSISGVTYQYSDLSTSPYKYYHYYIPTSLKRVTITSATSIGKNAFFNCSGLTSIEIPDSVTSIGSYAFRGCYKLIEVKNLSALKITVGFSNYGDVGYYAKNVYTATTGQSYLSTDKDGYSIYDDGTDKILVAYTGTETDLTLPSGITQIYQYAFYNCSSLTSIVIPDSVTSIGNGAFNNCSSLTSIVIPDSVTSIGYEAFYNCSSLTSIEIPDGVTSIGENAFSSCSSLTSVVIPDSVTSIGRYAFSGCSSLTSVTIGNSVTRIGYCAFFNCSSLTSVTFENPNGWWYSSDSSATSGTSISSSDLANTSTAATYLRSNYRDYTWKRS